MGLMERLLKDYFDGKERNKAVNPDEAVAYSYAVQGSILSGEGGEETKAAPLTLGIETVGGLMTKLIPRDTVIPTKKSQVFTTTQGSADYRVHSSMVFEGERSLTKDCRNLGKFDLNRAEFLQLQGLAVKASALTLSHQRMGAVMRER
ncbi:luminal-binding protein 1-like [Carya illinoinensis]|uniref:luminal-binding protein 1-like n=1 Tax=Carya illinoinensis TaxID=32201 RepID=UPI001C71A3D9|nr:luminal-binding protein 1-like [Carya illinoinensis]